MSLKIQYFPSPNFVLRIFIFFENFNISKNNTISVEAKLPGTTIVLDFVENCWFSFPFLYFQNRRIVSSSVLWNEDENFSMNVADGSWSDEIRA